MNMFICFSPTSGRDIQQIPWTSIQLGPLKKCDPVCMEAKCTENPLLMELGNVEITQVGTHTWGWAVPFFLHLLLFYSSRFPLT